MYGEGWAGPEVGRDLAASGARGAGCDMSRLEADAWPGSSLHPHSLPPACASFLLHSGCVLPRARPGDLPS